MKKFKEDFWKETSKLIDAHRKDNDERAAQGVVDCRILFTRLVKDLTTVSSSFTADEVVSELEQCETLDDAIMFFKQNWIE